MAGSNFDSERWRILSPYLDEALDCPDEVARRAWVDCLRLSHPELVDDVEQLLDAHDAAAREGFLDAKLSTPLGVMAGHTVGAYTLVSPIGQGGMGAVWLADRSDGRFHRRAAVKFPAAALSATGRARFLREGRIVARLGHPHIAQLLDAGVEPAGQPYLVLEYVDGEPIDQYCAHHALGVSQRLDLLLEVIDAVVHAHANLIVHRDLKPANVLVDVDGHVKLLDFGIAKLLEEEGPGDVSLTRESVHVMTPAYAAPEQMTGEPVTTVTDVYALGVLLYLLLTDHHPAGSDFESAAALTRAVVEIDPRRPSEVAPEARRRQLRGDLDTIVLKALKKKPAERYASAAALGNDLRAVLRHEPVSARADSVGYRALRFMRRNRLAVGLAAVITVAVAAGAVATLIEARTARAERDFAVRELRQSEAVNDLDDVVLLDAAVSGRPLRVDDLLASAAHIVERQQGDATTRVDLLIAVGRKYAGTDEFGKAATLLEQAHTLAATVSDPSTKSAAACGLAQVVANTGNVARGEALFEEGLHVLPDQSTFALDRAFCYERGSEVADRRGEGQTEVARAEEARRLLAQSPVRSEVSELSALVSLAGAYRTIGRYDQASAAFEQVLGRLSALGRDDTNMAQTTLNNWGVALSVLGRPLEAEHVLSRALALGRGTEGDEAVSPMLSVNYARVLDDLGRHDEAQGYADRAYDKAKGTGSGVIASQASLVRSAIYRHQGHVDRANDALNELGAWLERNLPRGHPAFAAWASQESLLALARGDGAAAARFGDQAVSIARAVFESRHQGADYLSIYLVRRSQLQMAQQRATEAAADASQALELLPIVDGSALTEVAGRAYVVLGRARQAQGRVNDAIAAFKAAVTNLTSALGPDHVETQEAVRLLAAAGHAG